MIFSTYFTTPPDFATSTLAMSGQIFADLVGGGLGIVFGSIIVAMLLIIPLVLALGKLIHPK